MNTQGCTNMAGTALEGSEFPRARGDQAEKVDKALGKPQRARPALEGVGEVNLLQLPGPIFYDFRFNSAKTHSK